MGDETAVTVAIIAGLAGLGGAILGSVIGARELSARLIVTAERYPPAAVAQTKRRTWDLGRLPQPDVDLAAFDVARELRLLLRSRDALAALEELVTALDAVAGWLVWHDPRPSAAYRVGQTTEEDVAEAGRAGDRCRAAIGTYELAVRRDLGVEEA